MKIWDAFTEAEEKHLDEAGFAELLQTRYGLSKEKAEEAAAIAYGAESPASQPKPPSAGQPQG